MLSSLDCSFYNNHIVTESWLKFILFFIYLLKCIPNLIMAKGG